MDRGKHPWEEDPLAQPAAIEQDLRQYADQLLETTRVEYVDEGVLLIMTPPAPPHRMIVRALNEAIVVASYTGTTLTKWAVNSENYQWELVDGSGRFYVPDLVVTDQSAVTPEDERNS